MTSESGHDTMEEGGAGYQPAPSAPPPTSSHPQVNQHLNQHLYNDSDSEFEGSALMAENTEAQREESKKNKALTIAFFLMMFVGLGNNIFKVLMYQPMYNYPLFCNMLITFAYLPCSFVYIWPMIKWGTAITPEAQRIPKKDFAVMGCLDSVAGIMQSLAVTYIANGSLVILLSQAAIPSSMIISRIFLKTKYEIFQFVGASVVASGILVVLIPYFISPDDSGNDVVLWSFVMIVSAIPQCLSTVYKERTLGQTEVDAIYLNGWVAVFQFMTAFPLLYPSAPAAGVPIDECWKNIYDGMKCFVGINTVTGGEHPDDCSDSAVYSMLYIVFNLGYNILIILIIKYGNANVLWLALTIMVPFGNIAFSFDFMPDHQALEITDIIGLVVIMGGLIVYRFWRQFAQWVGICQPTPPVNANVNSDSSEQPFVQSSGDSSTDQTNPAVPRKKSSSRAPKNR